MYYTGDSFKVVVTTDKLPILPELTFQSLNYQSFLGLGVICVAESGLRSWADFVRMEMTVSRVRFCVLREVEALILLKSG